MKKHALARTSGLAAALLLAGTAVQAEIVLKTATLQGIREVPAVSTAGQGIFVGVIDTTANTIQYSLVYVGLEGDVTQSHIHLGQEDVNGGIMMFLCSNLPSPPPGTPPCSPSGAVTGTLDASSVIGPAGQGIAAGEMAEAIRRILEGAGYVNVHSSLHPGGEVRGQLR